MILLQENLDKPPWRENVVSGLDSILRSKIGNINLYDDMYGMGLFSQQPTFVVWKIMAFTTILITVIFWSVFISHLQTHFNDF